MKAVVRFKDGHTEELTITHKEFDGSSTWGYAVKGIWHVPVSQSTTIHHPGGRVEKQWDEVVGSDWVDKEDWKRYHAYQPRWG